MPGAEEDQRESDDQTGQSVAGMTQALGEAGSSWEDLDAIAVTRGPGLIGSLLVGVCAAKAIAWQRDLPLLAVNHLEGHIRSAFIEHPEIKELDINPLRVHEAGKGATVADVRIFLEK